MSVNKYVLLTPYIKVHGTYDRTTVEVDRICPNHPNQKQGNAKFCPYCGSLITTIDRTVTVKQTGIEYLFYHKEYRDDELFEPAYCDVLLPNHAPPHDFKINNELSATVSLIGLNSVILEQLEWFKEKYGHEIEILQEGFGTENVEINWGLVQYWS